MDICGDDDVPPGVGMLLADQDEDRQFRNPGGLQVCGLHADIPLFFSKVKDKHVMTKFPNSWKTASTDYNDVSDRASTGRNVMHPRQFRRYSRRTIKVDLSISAEDDAARNSKCRVELPGFPF